MSILSGEDQYSGELVEQLELARSLDSERQTLEALASGELKPSGGIIRHRGEELKKTDIPQAIDDIAKERKQVAYALKVKDANCRQAHLLAAKAVDPNWHDYQLSLLHLLHCSEHLKSVASNEQALLLNTWHVITADGQIGYFEKQRILKVCKQTQLVMRRLSDFASQISLPPVISGIIGIENWQQQMPYFNITDVNKKNWSDWCQGASQLINNFVQIMSVIQSVTLDQLLQNEKRLAQHFCQQTSPEQAPDAGACPENYPVLMPGEEHILQRKLDLWNRFQLAHGVGPTLLRLAVSIGIVGGTIYSGLIGITL